MSDGLEVVGSGVDDIDAIMMVMDRAFDPAFGEAWTRAQCLGFLIMPGATAYLVKQEEQVCGFALARHVFEESELLMIGVDPNWQNQGIGRKLLIAVTAWARECGAQKLFLEVRSDNNAVQFYRNADFIQCGLRKGYYRGQNGSIRDALTLVKQLV